MVCFVLPDDVNALVQGIEKLYLSNDLRKKYRENAKRFIDNNNWSIEKKKLISAYKQITKQDN